MPLGRGSSGATASSQTQSVLRTFLVGSPAADLLHGVHARAMNRLKHGACVLIISSPCALAAAAAA